MNLEKITMKKTLTLIKLAWINHTRVLAETKRKRKQKLYNTSILIMPNNEMRIETYEVGDKIPVDGEELYRIREYEDLCAISPNVAKIYVKNNVVMVDTIWNHTYTMEQKLVMVMNTNVLERRPRETDVKRLRLRIRAYAQAINSQCPHNNPVLQ